MAVRIHVILPVVIAVLRGLREIRARWDRRESKGIPDVPDRKVTGEIRALWDRREYPALPAQEVQEEIPVRWDLPEIPDRGAVRGQEATQARREFRAFRASAVISDRKVIRVVKDLREMLARRALPVRWGLLVRSVHREMWGHRDQGEFRVLLVRKDPPVPWVRRV